MRISVFARGANPRVDRRILRKSMVYGTEQVALGRADWVDSSNPRQGIICRELLYFGPKAIRPALEDSGQYISQEIPGLRFEEPVSAAWRKDPASPALAVRSLPIDEVVANWYARA